MNLRDFLSMYWGDNLITIYEHQADYEYNCFDSMTTSDIYDCPQFKDIADNDVVRFDIADNGNIIIYTVVHRYKAVAPDDCQNSRPLLVQLKRKIMDMTSLSSIDVSNIVSTAVIQGLDDNLIEIVEYSMNQDCKNLTYNTDMFLIKDLRFNMHI